MCTQAPPFSLSPKRFIVSANTFTWKVAIEFLAKKIPELKERLPVIPGTEQPVGPFAMLDASKTESVHGMKRYVEWQYSVLDTVNDPLRVDKELTLGHQRHCSRASWPPSLPIKTQCFKLLARRGLRGLHSTFDVWRTSRQIIPIRAP